MVRLAAAIDQADIDLGDDALDAIARTSSLSSPRMPRLSAMLFAVPSGRIASGSRTAGQSATGSRHGAVAAGRDHAVHIVHL